MKSIDKITFTDPFDQGNAESFVNIYTSYGRKIFNLAYRMTGNREDAADITQDTFIQVFRNLATFRGESQVYTWIYSIAKNQCHRYYKQQKRGSFRSFEALMNEAAGFPFEEKISELEKQHLIDQVKEGCLTGLLRCLSFYQRTAFILHVLLHIPMKSVSIILGKSEGATKVLVHRARTNLKQFLCDNCSLYNADNPCRCESLVGFSLKHGWISLENGDKQTPKIIETAQIEREIRAMRKVIEIYNGLEDLACAEGLAENIRRLIQNQDWAILSDKKV